MEPPRGAIANQSYFHPDAALLKIFVATMSPRRVLVGTGTTLGFSSCRRLAGKHALQHGLLLLVHLADELLEDLRPSITSRFSTSVSRESFGGWNMAAETIRRHSRSTFFRAGTC